MKCSECDNDAVGSMVQMCEECIKEALDDCAIARSDYEALINQDG